MAYFSTDWVGLFDASTRNSWKGLTQLQAILLVFILIVNSYHERIQIYGLVEKAIVQSLTSYKVVKTLVHTISVPYFRKYEAAVFISFFLFYWGLPERANQPVEI